MDFRRRIREIVEPAGSGDRASRAFDIFILTLIALNVVGIILESVKSIHSVCPRVFEWFEIASIAIFSFEYMVRIWSCVASPRYSAPVIGRIRFALTPLLLVDMLAVLPFYLPFVGVDLRFFRTIRLFRVFRVAKLGRYSTALQTLGRVLRAKRSELGVTVFVLILLLILASTLIYYAEYPAQPKVFSSIPASMWWAVATLTTVGYGDVYPVTVWGKLMASVIAVLGIGMFALPTGILGAGFVEEIQNRRKQPTRCPHCGKKI